MKKQLILGLFFLATVVSPLSLAQKVPHAFTSGSRAVAAQVNENFQWVVDLVDVAVSDSATNKAAIVDNTATIGILQSTIAGLTNKSIVNTNNIQSLQTTIADLSNKSAQSNKSTQIVTNTASIATNAGEIFTHSTDVAHLTNRVTTLEDSAVTNDTVVSDLSQRVTRLESQQTRPDSDYEGFTMPFSAAGEARNVIVLKREFADGRVHYKIRLRYENRSDVIPVDGVDTFFSYHAIYLTADYDAQGDLNSLSGWIDALNNTNYSNYTRFSVNYDVSSGFSRSIGDDGYRYEIVDTSLSAGPIRNINKDETIYLTGDDTTIKRKLLFTRFYTLKNSYDANNGISFDNALTRIEHRSKDEGDSRISVQGIGVVELIPHLPLSSSLSAFPDYSEKESPSYKISYYNVNGTSRAQQTHYWRVAAVIRSRFHF